MKALPTHHQGRQDINKIPLSHDFPSKRYDSGFNYFDIELKSLLIEHECIHNPPFLSLFPHSLSTLSFSPLFSLCVTGRVFFLKSMGLSTESGISRGLKLMTSPLARLAHAKSFHMCKCSAGNLGNTRQRLTVDIYIGTYKYVSNNGDEAGEQYSTYDSE